MMEDSDEELRVAPELYFLIAKFLSGGPLKESAKTLLKELESVEVLPRRLDWHGRSHAQTYHELERQYGGVSWRRLAAVCARALCQSQRRSALAVCARLSLLGEGVVGQAGVAGAHTHTHTTHSLVRRVCQREAGVGDGARAGTAVLPARALASLRLQRRTLGHLSAVYCVVFDCTGRYVVTGADDLLVKAWSALDGRLLCTFRGAGAEITDVCVSGDNRLVAAGSVDRVIRVWSLQTGAPAAVLHAHSGTITSVHWRPAGEGRALWLASTSTDGSVAFWGGDAGADGAGGTGGAFLSRPVQFMERMRPGACHMICAAWSAGGALLAAGSADHHVRLYAVGGVDGADGGPGAGVPRRVLEVAAHADAVDSVCWAHRGLRFVSGSKDGTAALWHLHATQWRHTALRMAADNPGQCGGASGAGGAGGAGEEGRKLKVTMVCWDRSDAYVCTAVSDSTVRVWCSLTCAPVRTLRGHRDEAYVLEAHPFLPGVLLSAGHDGQLVVWDAGRDAPLVTFQNTIEGQGEGAIFDAKWGGGAGDQVAATDSHGHLLLLGLGEGDPLLRRLPTELFFHTDYRPIVRDALGGAVDEQTEVPPHLMPPPFLVDVEGAPYPPHLQRLVPGRENLALNQLIPLTEERRAPASQLDLLIQALVGEDAGAGAVEEPGGVGGGGGGGGGVWRGGGVRRTAGSWQRGAPLEAGRGARPPVPALSPALLRHVHARTEELHAWEEACYRREMRRRPLMICSAPRPRRRAPRAPRPAPRATPSTAAAPAPATAPTPTAPDSDHTSTSQRSGSSTTDSTSVTGSSDSDSSSSGGGGRRRGAGGGGGSSSSYSDWVAESGGTSAALAPPAARARACRRPRPVRPRAATPPTPTSPAPPTAAAAPPSPLPDAYRPGDWITAVSPRKAPYHPQIGDECVYFRLGHQRYFEAVAEKDVYKVNPRDKPWERTTIQECEFVKVVGIKYIIKPPRIVSLKLCTLAEGGGAPRTFTVKYHDMADVIDFLVLKQQYDTGLARGWGAGDRFRCIIDDSWWSGAVEERLATDTAFLSLRVRWDNGEVERMSPWDLEPGPAMRGGGGVPVSAPELEAALYRPAPADWPPRGDRAEASRAIADHVTRVMSLAVAEPFAAPVDLAQYPSYARVVPYPVDLSTIRARFRNAFYRRAAAAMFDARYVAVDAELFNERGSAIVRQARLVAELLLYAVARWWDADVLAKYRELSAPAAPAAPAVPPAPPHGWREECARVLREVCTSDDAEPFLAPVSPEQAPDYAALVPEPCDLGAVRRRLRDGEYAAPDHFCRDMRLIFANSRLYNTNKRSRIYCMTVRLSALFEALWSSARLHTRRPPRASRTARPSRPPRTREQYGSSDEETLAATSRRQHQRRRDKGKGVGKKSKSNVTAPASSPHTETEMWGRKRRRRRRRRRSSASSASPPPARRRRATSSSLSSSTSSSCSAGEGAAGAGGEGGGGAAGQGAATHYESDRSYRPRCSTDDDRPLTAYRRPRARARPARAAPTYNEDSEEEADTAAIAQRARLHRAGTAFAVAVAAGRRRARHAIATAVLSDMHGGAGVSGVARVPALSVSAVPVLGGPVAEAHAAGGRSAGARAVDTDHNYFNGHAHTSNGRGVWSSSDSSGGGSGAVGGAGGAVSVSSRGRVRRLTAKARGLLRD